MLSLDTTFVHLRVHTSFSLSNGMISAKKLGSILSEANVPAVGVSDINNLFGGFEFSQYVSGAGVQPIIGAEVSLIHQIAERAISDNVVLICTSLTGYKNLSKIISEIHLTSTNGCASEDLLREYSEDIICLWGGGDGIAAELPNLKQPREAVSYVSSVLKSTFGNRFYIEIQRCGEPWERFSESILLAQAYNDDIPIVATNDVYYLRKEDSYYHDILQCIGKGEFEIQDDRKRKTDNHYLRSPSEMRELFSDLPEAISNTIEIAKRSAFFLTKKDPILPAFPVSAGLTADEELHQQALRGLEERLLKLEERVGQSEAARLRPIYQERFDFEFSTITRMGFSGYFLIVSDFMTWAKEQRIPIGVRGSGATSIIAWCMNITHLDPIRFSLVFERFLNPERVSLPDFDVDFCQKQRSKVIEYVREKYGRESVAQIITFGKLQAKAAIRDVGRVIQAPFPVVDKIAKLVADAKDLRSAIEAEPALGELIANDPLAKKTFSIAEKLEGQYRHSSTHAAGVIISDKKLVEYVPLYKDPTSDMPVTQFQYKDAESVGLVKFDFLGLRTLTIIATAVDLVKETEGVDVDVLSLDFEDQAVFEMLAKADTTGVFQLESPGMRDLVLNLRPSKIEHLIALISLYRPGPMDSIPSYIRRANGDEPVEYDHPSLAPVLEETYGIITYQEDVMKIARELGGYSLGEADLLRRAMGKKIASEMEPHEKKFISGAERLGITSKTAKVIFEKCAKFAGYGFNKGHAAAYSQVAYQTAYLKCHYPAEFYCACMTVDIEAIDRLKLYSKELRARNIDLLPPDVNHSFAEFCLEKLKTGTKSAIAIRYGMAALKNVGMAAATEIASERLAHGKFLSTEDFFTRVQTRQVSKAVIQQLIKAGALDSLNGNRNYLLSNFDRLYDIGKSMSKAANSDQGGLFGASVGMREVEVSQERFGSLNDNLAGELASIGFYLSGHPLDQYTQLLQNKRYTNIEKFKRDLAKNGGATGQIPCLIQSVQTRRSKKTGNKYGFVVISDQTDELEALSFSVDGADFVGSSDEGNLCVALIEGEVDETRTRYSLRSLHPLERASGDITKLVLEISEAKVKDRAYINDVKNLIDQMRPGSSSIELSVNTHDGKLVVIEMPQKYNVDVSLLHNSPHRFSLLTN